MVNPWVVGGGIAAGIWALLSSKGGQQQDIHPAVLDHLTSQATQIAAQQVQAGIPVAQAAASAANTVVDKYIQAIPTGGNFRVTWSMPSSGKSGSQYFSTLYAANAMASNMMALPAVYANVKVVNLSAQAPAPAPVPWSSAAVPTTPTGPILSLSDPRIAQAVATAKSGGAFAAMASEISASGMPIDVRNALVAQGWTWTGSVFSPGGLVPPGVTTMLMKA
jgi:hypothetical protein